jgi:hypothetical protein
MMRKLFKISEIPQWKILGKEVVDEIIFRTIKPRNRLILELMARGGGSESSEIPPPTYARMLIIKGMREGAP